MKRIRYLIPFLLVLSLLFISVGTTPAHATTVDLQIAASADDSYCDGTGAGHNYPTDTYANCFNVWVKAGLRWSIDIPDGATITTAYIQLESTGDEADEPGDGIIELFDEDSATSFSSSFWTRAVDAGAGSVTWNYEDWTTVTWYDSPEIKTLVQAFIDRPGYSPGNYIGLRITSEDEVEDWRAFYTWNYSTTHTHGAKLHIEYAVLPTVTTEAATSVEATTATGNGTITDTGGEDCDKCGFVYDTSSHSLPGNVAPTSSGYASYAENTGAFGTVAFTKGLTSLSTGTTYYVRAYAHNSAGYSYGGEVSFLTKPAAPTGVTATDGTHTDKVVVTWTKSTGATGYRVYRDSAVADSLGDVATYDDTGAAPPTITPGTAAASDGTSTAHVSLSLSGQSANNGTTHTYKVVAVNATGDSADSNTDTGYRGADSLTYQWQRSAADSDADYSDIAGANTASYDDTGAPADGSGRYYRCVENATGATQQISIVDRGYRWATYTLTYTAGANGSISGTSPQTVNHGADGTAVTAVPATGYHFVDWSDASTANPRTDTNVTANISVTANFAINTYTITASAGDNGLITPSDNVTVNYGADQAFTITPDANYHVADVLVDGSSIGAVTSYTFTSVTANHTISASFAIDTYTLTYTAGTNGSISGTSPQTVDYGANGSAVTAVPDTGYHFVNWSDASIDNPRTDTSVTADITVTANFAINTYTLTYTAGANGSISGTSPQTVDYDNDGSAVTAVPDTGYHFVDWSDASTANPRTDTNVTADITVTANFAISGGGGGGGGGGASMASPTTTQLLNIDMFGSRSSVEVTKDGIIVKPSTIVSLNKEVTLTLARGARLTSGDSKVPMGLALTVADEIPPIPDGLVLVSQVYDCIAFSYGTGELPVAFDPSATLLINYSPEVVPENISSIFIAYYDAELGWVSLDAPNDFVAEAGVAAAQVSHFTPFAVLAELVSPSPASFEVRNLNISPSQVVTEEEVTISAQIANIGGMSGDYTLMINVEGLLETSQVVELAPGQGQEVSFTVTPDTPGSYEVEIGGLQGSFMVVVPPTTPPAEAAEAGGFKWLTPWLIAAIAATVLAVLAVTLVRRRPRPVPVAGKPLPSKPVSAPSPVKKAMAAIAGLASTLVRKRPRPTGIPKAPPEPAPTAAKEPRGPIPVPSPVRDLRIIPNRIKPGGTTYVFAEATNNNPTASSFSLVLKVRGVVEAVKELTLGPGQSQKVAFVVLRDKPGVYDVDLEGLKGSFIVEEPSKPAPTVAEEPQKPAPTAAEEPQKPAPTVAEEPQKPAPVPSPVKNLEIIPGRVKPRRIVNVFAEVTNNHPTANSFSLILKVRGVVEAVKEITLGPWQSRKVAFTVLRDKPGVYEVDLGDLKGSFTVEK